MLTQTSEIIKELNNENIIERLFALREISKLVKEGKETRVPTDEVNNHIHTFYSFSPYSPTSAAYHAWKAGLTTAGIIDHDSVAGCREMVEACKIIGLGCTVGFEIRVNFSGTSLEGKKLNNPDSENIAYMTIQGVPHQYINKASEFLKPINEARNKRNRAQVEKLNAIIKPFGIKEIDFENDVYGISKASEGGSITERHILYALSLKIIEKQPDRNKLVAFLKDDLKINLPSKIESVLLDNNNPHFVYDLLGILKSSFSDKFFIQPDENECIHVTEAVNFANSIYAIPSYAYLGDVAESPTGDKKAEKFEDEFLDELFKVIKEIGFKAVTYMPPRNTLVQLQRVQTLCKQNDLMEISGVDINSSRQSFNCPIILEPAFKHLVTTTWALIGHEVFATENEKKSLFHPLNPHASLSLEERIKLYADKIRQ